MIEKEKLFHLNGLQVRVAPIWIHLQRNVHVTSVQNLKKSVGEMKTMHSTFKDVKEIIIYFKY